MTPPSRSLGVLAFALAIQGCGRPGISSLQDRKVLVRSAVGNSFIPGPEMFEVTLDYDVGRCAGALDSGLHATMNGRAIQAVTRGSKPHTSGGLLERRKFPCERPRFSTQLTDADKAAPVTTVEISDGRTTVTAEFVDLYATRTMALVNGTALRPGEPVQLSWTNTDDRFEKLTDETWTGGFSAAPPLLNFRYDGESLRSDVRHEGDPVGWQGEGVTATGSRIAFQVPARAEGGPGVLRARQATGWGLWQEARTCKGADRCLAQPATTSAEARAFVVAPASMRAFSSLANQIESRFNATATLLEDGRVLFAGGVRVGVHLASAEVWDPKTRTWTATSPMHGTRSNHGAIRLPGNRVLVVGGASFDGLGREGAECGRAALRSEIWDAGTGTWSRAGCLPKGFDATTGLSPLALPDGRVVVATESATDQVGTSGLVSFDDKTGQWTELSRFPRRDDYGLAVLPDGRILRIGGIIPLTGGLEINEVAFFDPKTRRWTPGPSLNAARRGAFVLRLPEGKIAVVGGASQLEVFDPSLQVWEAGAKLPYGFGAAPPVFAALDDGHVIGIAHERAIIWTPGDAEWKPLTTVTGKRAFFSLVPIEGGLLIAGGGENGHMSEFLRLRL